MALMNDHAYGFGKSRDNWEERQDDGCLTQAMIWTRSQTCQEQSVLHSWSQSESLVSVNTQLESAVCPTVKAP